MIEESAGLGKTSAVPWTKRVLLQHEGFTANFVKNRKCQVQILLALLKVFQIRVSVIKDTFAFMLDLSLRESRNIIDPLYELFAHRLNQTSLLFNASINNDSLLLFAFFIQESEVFIDLLLGHAAFF